MDAEDRVKHELSTLYGREGGVLADYMDFLYDERGLARSTAYNYYCVTRMLALFLKHRRQDLACEVDETVLTEVHPEDMGNIQETEWQAFLGYVQGVLGEADTSLSTRIAAIRGFYRWMEMRHGIPLPSFIAQAASPSYKPRPFVVVTEDMAAQFEDALKRQELSERNICIFRLMLRWGVSLEEICELTIDDLELNKIIIQPRGKLKSRSIPIEDSIAQDIDAYLKVRKPPVDGSKAFFVSKAKGKLQVCTIQKAFRKAMSTCRGAIPNITAKDIQMTARKNIVETKGVEAAAKLTSITTQRYMRRRYGKAAPTDISED